MMLTGHRTTQYIGLFLILGLLAGGYWYFAVRAVVKTNTAGSQPQGNGQLDSALVAYFKLDENTGTSTTDASTNSARKIFRIRKFLPEPFLLGCYMKNACSQLKISSPNFFLILTSASFSEP